MPGRGGNASKRFEEPSNPPPVAIARGPKNPPPEPKEKTDVVIRLTEPKIVLGFMCGTAIYLIVLTLLYTYLYMNVPIPQPGPSVCPKCPDVSRLEEKIKDLNGEVKNIKGDVLDLKTRVRNLNKTPDPGETQVNYCDGCVKLDELENKVADIAKDKSSELNITITTEIMYQVGLVKEELERANETVDGELGALKNNITVLRTNVTNLNTDVAEVDKKLMKRIDRLNRTLIEINLQCAQKLNGSLIEMNATLSNRIGVIGQNCIRNSNSAPNSTDEVIATLMMMNSTLSERITVVNRTLAEINATHSRRNNHTSATLNLLNSTISREVNNTNIALLNVSSTLAQKIHGTNATLVDVNTTLSQKIINVNATLMEINSTLSQEIYDVNATLSQRIHNVSAMLSQRICDVNTSLTTVNSSLSQRTHGVNVTLSQRISDVNTSLMEDHSKRVDSAFAGISGVWFSLKWMGISHDITLQNIKSLKENLISVHKFNKKVGTDNLHKLLNLSDTTEKNSHNLANLAVFMGLGFALVVVFILVICHAIAKGSGTPVYAHDTGQKGSAAIKSQPLQSVLDQIHQKSLDSNICVLSFYAETQPLHSRLTASACQAVNVSRTQFLIGRHEDIPNIPPCKIVLVYVDFNERDIILENPKREVGDLKLTTVKGARKMGADVFVIYVRDKGSMSLKDGLLFNPNLRSVYNHEELSDLKNRERVMSTYENFTHFQRQHLERCICTLR